MVEETNCRYKISVDFGEWKEDEVWKITEVGKYRDNKVNLPHRTQEPPGMTSGEGLRRCK